jgi:hypothetical protein
LAVANPLLRGAKEAEPNNATEDDSNNLHSKETKETENRAPAN